MKKSDPIFPLTKLPVRLLLMLMVLFLQSAMAQSRLSLRVRPGVSFVTTEVIEARLNAGISVEAGLAYRVLPHISAYGSWAHDSFRTRESFAGSEVSFDETGYGIGLQLVYPITENGEFDYFFRGGLIVSKIEIENSEHQTIADSGYGGGFQVEAGLCFSLGGPWHLIPGIKYQTLSREITSDAGTRRIDLNFLSGGVSVSCLF